LRYYEYVEPLEGNRVRIVVVSEETILQRFYPLWIYRMKRVGKDDLISTENCIEDFVVIHWAYFIGDF
jgi:hypothetical protein